MPEQAETVRGETSTATPPRQQRNSTPILPGLVAAIVIGGLSWFLGGQFPRLGGVTIAILLGITVGNLLPNAPRLNQGARVAEKQVLPLAIALLGVELQLSSLTTLGPSAALVILATLITAFSASLLLGPLFGYSREFSLLIGAGNGVCGSSAVAAASQAIDAEETDIGISISIVNLLGTLGIFLVPTFAGLLALDVTDSGLLVGGSLQAVGQVVAAGNILGPEVGLVAVAVKMGRVLMLGPIVVLLGLAIRRNRTNPSGRRSRIGIPAFIIGFFMLSVLASFSILTSSIVNALATTGKLLLIVAMAGIGMRIHFRALFKSAPRALIFAGVVSTIQVIVLVLIITLVTT